MGSTQIRSRDSGSKERPFSLVYVGAALRTTTPPARRENSQWQQDVPGADVLGSAITLPKVKPDADLDADEADADEEDVNEANESAQARWDGVKPLRGGPGRADLRGAGGETRQEGDGVVMCWGTQEGAISGWG
jgi:hypothetical protein